jgi:hypothetical protein
MSRSTAGVICETTGSLPGDFEAWSVFAGVLNRPVGSATGTSSVPIDETRCAGAGEGTALVYLRQHSGLTGGPHRPRALVERSS